MGGFLFKFETTTAHPVEPLVLRSTVPNRSSRDTIPLGSRTLLVPEVRDTDADVPPVLVVEDVAGMSELARLGGISYVEAGAGRNGKAPRRSSRRPPARSVASPFPREEPRLRGLPVAASVLGAGVARAVVVIVAEVPLLPGQDRPHAASADAAAGCDHRLESFASLLVTVAVPSVTRVCSSCHSLYLLQTGVCSDWRGIWKFHKEKTRGLSPIAASTWSRSAGSRLSAANRGCQGTCAPAPAVLCTTGGHNGSVGASLAFRTWARMQRLGKGPHACLAAALFSPFQPAAARAG